MYMYVCIIFSVDVWIIKFNLIHVVKIVIASVVGSINKCSRPKRINEISSKEKLFHLFALVLKI